MEEKVTSITCVKNLTGGHSRKLGPFNVFTGSNYETGKIVLSNKFNDSDYNSKKETINKS